MLERLYNIELVKKKPYIAFFLGLVYSIIGIGIAAILFKKDPAIVTVAITAILLYPTIKGLVGSEIGLLSKTKHHKLRRHTKLVMIYLLIFLGVMIGFSLFSVMLPSLATNALFQSQIGVLYSSVGGAGTFNSGLFGALFMHNLVVLGLAFIMAFFIGDGGIFLLVWNASVWGTIFGNLAKTSALAGALNPFIIFGIILVIVLPHTLLEGLSYIFSAISGGVVSRSVISEKKANKKIVLIRNAITILVIAIVTLVIAVFIEQYVLINSGLYTQIIGLSGLI
ncbi:stage II sporulation protein M [Candidatus Woesearchaeota archaeon]|jgi:hypothetical protein|nr:stage II sporulation protein M [Candidatus Woesearchaeota archaeon]MBT4368893.1 stage II sporulation protein M [Candidatus Woesearchaeota archaeon]MBT4712182.1 stage II sporulation protein M [Candidatus Woesearchaeota archaeon]MBT6639070.1 stage II sporulation protein M [Candidatus Woesearchaeota archaeon]MBT7134270.1 stage II sporulation protein M [Candidatus Woesearchaeota archaeon]